VGQHAKVVVVHLLGGLDWWRYGVERLSSLARERSIALAFLPGEDRDDPRLADASTLPDRELDALLRFFREGGPENLQSLLRRLAQHSGSRVDVAEPRPLPRMAGYIPGEGAVDVERLVAFCRQDRPRVPILFYRAMLLAADTAPIDALCRALVERGLAPAPLVVPSLKDRAAADFVRSALARLEPAVIVTTTAFAAAASAGAPTPFDDTDVPVLQAVIATTKRAAWTESPRGLGPADLARRPARARRADIARCGGLQRTASDPGGPLLQRGRKRARGRPDRDAGRPHRGPGEAALHAARRAAAGGIAAGLSRCVRPLRICRWSRCSRQRDCSIG
jgi:cobaltochelatase CobN